jgi:TRAP-type C4-dicarboxylate transport system substrate-binding protein
LRAVEAAGVTIIHPDKELFAQQVEPMLESYRNDPVIYPLIREIRAIE